MPEPFMEAVASGDRRRALVALRDQLAEAIAEVDAKDMAPLSRQLSLVLADLDSLEQPKEASAVDDLASRRAGRRSRAAGQ